MSFMRERIAQVECRPPQGRYEGSYLRIYLHSATAGCNIIFTLDGTEPVESSDRDQGYRCEHYHPKGFELRGGGRHTVTVVAIKRGLVSTKPTTFTFFLDGPPRKRRLFGTERNLDSAFQVASRQHAEGAATNVCMLRDISTREDVRRTIQSYGSEHVRMFKLKYRPHEVNRSITFERVATPAVHMTMPILPLKTPSELARSESLRNTAARCMTPATYDTPACFSPVHDGALLPAFSRCATPLGPLEGSLFSRPQSPAAFHLTFNGSVTIMEDRSKSVLPRIRTDHHQERCTQQGHVNTELSLFELKQGLTQLRVDDGAVQEAADRAEEEQYRTLCEAVVEKEIQRKSFVSKIHARVAMDRIPANAQRHDVAEVDHEALSIFVACAELARVELLRIVVTTKTFSAISKELNGIQNIAAADLASALGTSPEDIHRSFKRLSYKLAEGVRYPCKVIVALIRYLVCLAEPIPEAPLFMFLLIWRITVEKKAGTDGGSIGRVSLLSAIDVYRRTRGANAIAVSQLYDAYYHGLEWGRDGTISIPQLLQHWADHIPHVDAAIAWMNDVEHPMYKRTVSPSSL